MSDHESGSRRSRSHGHGSSKHRKSSKHSSRSSRHREEKDDEYPADSFPKKVKEENCNGGSSTYAAKMNLQIASIKVEGSKTNSSSLVSASGSSSMPNSSSHISPTYMPSSSSSTSSATLLSNATSSNGATLKRRDKRLAVYAGKANTTFQDRVYRLEDICIRVLMNNLDAIGYVGHCPFYLLKPVLEKCTVPQLKRIEECNPQLLDDTDILWRGHVQKKFKNHTEDDMSDDEDSWRELYDRLLETQEAKLKALTRKIKERDEERKLPVKTSKLAPIESTARLTKDVLRRQRERDIANSDVGFLPMPPRGKFSDSGTLQGGVGNNRRGLSATSGANAAKPKPAPAMRKAMAMYKSRFTRK